MAIHVYNTKQQALTSSKIAELFSFISNDFGGLVSDIQEPILFGSNTWRWNTALQNTQITFLGGGVNIGFDVPTDSKSFHTSGCSMWGLDVTVPDPNASISKSAYEELAHIVRIQCTNISTRPLYIVVSNPSGNPHNKEYYEYSVSGYVLSEDTTVQVGKTYYYAVDKEVFEVTGAYFSDRPPVSFEYYGNTVWLDQGSRFFIPFCCKDGSGNLISMIFNRDQAGYESFLSAQTYSRLLEEIGDKFVWRVGGDKLGDVGQLNITDNIIRNKVAPTSGVKINDPVFIQNISTQNTGTAANNILCVSPDTGKVYKSADKYVIPINHGGTQATNEGTARNNLGFSYGTADPTGVPKRKDGSIDIGALYFKIL